MTEPRCSCVIVSRREDEDQREWFKRWMCMHHWIQTDYYKAKLKEQKMNEYPPMKEILETQTKYLHCHRCGKQVSTGFIPIPTDTPDRGLIIRAWIECPECIEEKGKTNG